MKKHLSFLKLKASQGLLLVLMLFSINSYAQTLIEYNFSNAANALVPTTVASSTPPLNPVLKYYNSAGTQITPTIVNGMLQLNTSLVDSYLELTFNATNFEYINVEFYGEVDNTLFGSGNWTVKQMLPSPEDELASYDFYIINGGIRRRNLNPNANNNSNIKIRITAKNVNGAFTGLTKLRLDDLKITVGSPNITVYKNTPVDDTAIIPNNSEASEIYNTVFVSSQTLVPGEEKTYKIKNFRGVNLPLNAEDIIIVPDAGTTLQDFRVTDTSDNISNIPRVTEYYGGFLNLFETDRGEFKILFTPQAEGLRSATVVINSNGTPSPYSFKVIGSGRSCNVSNTTYITNTMDPNLVQKLKSTLLATDFVTGKSNGHLPQLFAGINTIYPNVNDLYTSTSPTSSWFTKNVEKKREFGGDGVNISQLRNVSVEFNVAAFADSNANFNNTKGVTNTDYIVLSVTDKDGNWFEVMQLNGSDSVDNSKRKKYGFNINGTPFTKDYNLALTSISNTTTIINAKTYTRFKFNIPYSVSKNMNNFKFSIRARANDNAVWLIDDVRITADNADYKTWNGSAWSPTGRPGKKEKAVFNGNYDFSKSGETGDLEVCECEVFEGKTLTIPANKTLTVQGKVINDTPNNADNFLIKSDGNLIQIDNGVINEGKVNAQRFVKDVKNSFDADKHMDYIYWSSPVSGQNLHNFSIGTPLNRIYQYNETNDYFNPVNLGTEPNFLPGKGYAFRAEDGLPYGTTGYEKTYEFKGVPNNGVIPFTIQRSPNNGTVQHGYNMIGNPYPSNINFDLLHAANSSAIFKTAWFWVNDNFTIYQTGSGYVGNGYAVYNGTGGVDGTTDSNPNNGIAPDGIIKVGQGFLVQMKNAPAANPPNTALINFDNNMRVKTAGQFYSKSEEQKDRFWLKLVSPSNTASTMLLGYIPGATEGFEQDFDAEAFGLSSDLFYSNLEEKRLVIQGKGTFNNEDKIALGANFFSTGTYTISLMNPEGVFANGQSIYLKDNQTGTITKLTDGSYTFETNKGETNGRFEIIYKPESVLVTDAVTKDQIVVYRNQDNFVILSPKTIASVEVFEMSGKLLKVLKPNNKQAVLEASTLARGIYILHIKATDGEVTNKKIIR